MSHEHSEHIHHEHGHHHHHDFENNEKKTFIVIVFTLITMIAEIVFGYLSNSMALFADGCHMGTHALALSVAYCAYIYMRKISGKLHSHEVSEKISALAGYTSAIFLTLTAIYMVVESFERLTNPLTISFNEAILVAIIGLVVNFVCLIIMEYKNNSEKDYNFKSAYLHILTDTLTSVFAIVALFAGKYFGLYFLDPIMGFVGAGLILKWGFGLIKETFYVLSDAKLLN